MKQHITKPEDKLSAATKVGCLIMMFYPTTETRAHEMRRELDER